MSLPIAPTLSAQRCLLQQQLRVQRQQIVLQLSESTNAEPQFPRSATMRFLASRTGLKLLTELAVRQLGLRYPGVMANAFTFTRLFSSKNN